MSKHFLSILLFCKDENSYIPEFIDYHSRIGVEHFYIFDNGSRRSLREFQGPNVTVEEWCDRAIGRQTRCYEHACRTINSEWLAIIDTDEFIYPKVPLHDLLRSHKDAAAMTINWRMYGSNGHVTKPRSVLRGFTKWGVYSQQVHVKSIVRPDRVAKANEPHSFQYFYGGHAVSPCGRRQEGPFNMSPDYSLIQLNHYWTRSWDEWLDKQERGRGDGVPNHHDPKLMFDVYNEATNTYEDKAFQHYLTSIGVPAA